MAAPPTGAEGLSLPPQGSTTLSTSRGRRRSGTRTRRCLPEHRPQRQRPMSPRGRGRGPRGAGQDEGPGAGPGAGGRGWVCPGPAAGLAALTEGLEVLDRGHATLRREAGAAGSESARVTAPAPQCHGGREREGARGGVTKAEGRGDRTRDGGRERKEGVRRGGSAKGNKTCREGGTPRPRPAPPLGTANGHRPPPPHKMASRA